MGTNNSFKASSTATTKSSIPSPNKAETATVLSSNATSYLRYSASSSSRRSILFKTRTIGLFPTPKSDKTARTARSCFSHDLLATSITCTNTSASFTSSKVARNAATRLVGSFWIKPTVSVKRNSGCVDAPGNFTLRVVGSNVANIILSTITPALVKLFKTLLLPAFVYPTSDKTGSPMRFRPRLCIIRCFCTSSIFLFNNIIRSRTSRLSISNCDSPIPRNPTPPAPDCRSKCVHIFVSLGFRYSWSAKST
mmetsp:Transcript_13554/g.13321  ORF Transcript_13554/g.13321 Transcript_13554/m.13321 type:complete len:252 (-) Transcript_13554:15-770(-)